MKLHALAILCATQLVSVSASLDFKKRANHIRQAPTSAPPASSSAPQASSAPTSAPGTAPPGVTVTTHTSVSVVTAPPAQPSGTAPVGSGVPPLVSITSGMLSGPPLSATTTFTPGATPPIPNAPSLPTPFVFNAADWPPQDRVPDTNSPEVQEWMKELEGFNVPGFNPTVDGSCAGDPAAAQQAQTRGWWTCGGWTRDTDIVACPDKLTWGVSFDDGPGPYTQQLLNYLHVKNISATFFIIGSRLIERPLIAVEEYMSGNEISVHTWSHRPLTSLTTEQIVAELGWTRKAIKTILGVTPVTMRPPFGDIDDRVRAISLAMGLIPIMWTRTPTGGVFDTNDWRVPAGQVTGQQSFETFQNILRNASTLDTGFIVLQHDLYADTVDLATGYFLEAALNNNPPLTLKPIGQCMKFPSTDLYLETTTNTTFPYPNRTDVDVDGDGTPEASKGEGNSDSNNNGAVVAQSSLLTLLFATALAATSSLLL